MATGVGALTERIFRFGQYELSEQATELRKNGVRLKLQEQPFRVLIALLERPGELVTREELQALIWSSDTFVDFDRGLNTAISKLRAALSDDAANPRYIETQARRGYRFIAPVSIAFPETKATVLPAAKDETALPTGAPSASEGSTVASENRTGSRKWLWGAFAAGVCLVAALLALMLVATPKPPQITYALSALTTYPGLEYSPAISPDGKRVAFAWTGPDSHDSFSIYVKEIGREQPLRITQPSSDEADGAPQWTPDGRYLLFVRRSGTGRGIYKVSAEGGQVEKLIPLNSAGAPVRRRSFSVSPDGSKLVYADVPSDQHVALLLLLDLRTLQVRQLTEPEKQLLGDSQPAFSPDGEWIAFARERSPDEQVFVVRSTGGELKQVTSTPQVGIEGLAWSQDGRYIVIGGDELRVVEPFTNSAPRVIPGLPRAALTPNIRGDKLAFAQASWNSNIWRMTVDGQPSQPRPFIVSTKEQGSAAYSPDGTEIAFQSNRSGHWEIWKCNRDGSNPVQLTDLRAPLSGTPRWSADGKWIAFDSLAAGPSDIYVVSSDGAVFKRLTKGNAKEILPNWSRDGKWIYFVSDITGAANIWKISVPGGQQEQVTKSGGVYPSESPDGRFLYYSRSESDATLWRMPVEGGAEEKVPGAPLPFNASYWSMGSTGIYVIDGNSDLVLVNPQTGSSTKLAHNSNFCTNWSMAVSPDGREVLWSQMDSTGADLVLVENFNPATQAAVIASAGKHK